MVNNTVSTQDYFKKIRDIPAAEIVLVSLGFKRQSIGRRYVGVCPFHPGKPKNEARKRAFVIDVDNNSFSCSVCKRQGSLFDLMVQHENVSKEENARIFMETEIRFLQYYVDTLA